MARAKNTTRAEARRRYRAAHSPQTLVDQDEASLDEEAVPAEQVQRRRGFRFPDIRGDLRALPGMFRTRRLLWLPFILVIGAFVTGMAGNRGLLPAPLIEVAAFYVQLALLPSALLTYFIGGFLAPRGSYLIGFLLGLLTGPLFVIYAFDAAGGAPTAADGRVLTFGEVFAQYAFQGVLFGTFAAGFASWYRGFLRSSQERAKANRIARDEQQRLRQKEADREARRTTTRRTTSP
ncbi:MAG: hypothetical protein H0V04_08765 [Chloroflexi bacterium]|nr:hypothetical protein [Chloroflexota bacterium]